jgi:hypothetical protein
MVTTSEVLDQEWRTLCGSLAGAEALDRWRAVYPAFAGVAGLADVLALRRHAVVGEVLSALAALSPTDVVAARTLLQALLPGLVQLARSCVGEPEAFEEMAALAWERIRTYPSTRTGSVPANVLLDVRKAYVAHRRIDAPRDDGEPAWGVPGEVESAESTVMAALAVADRVGGLVRRGVLDSSDAELIVRTRVLDVPLEEIARARRTSVGCLVQRRWRAETRLRRRVELRPDAA